MMRQGETKGEVMHCLKTLAASALAVATVVAGAPAAHAAAAFEASFTIQFPKGHPASNAPCPEDAFCGVGNIAGVGAATITIEDETFDEIPDTACFAVTRTESVDLLDHSGSLVLLSVGTFCPPGRSGDSHSSDNSYGSPGKWTFAFTVDSASSTGSYVGATGAGTESMVTAGGIGVWHLEGNIATA
jgi:hypothetical protein